MADYWTNTLDDAGKYDRATAAEPDDQPELSDLDWSPEEWREYLRAHRWGSS